MAFLLDCGNRGSLLCDVIVSSRIIGYMETTQKVIFFWGDGKTVVISLLILLNSKGRGPQQRTKHRGGE